MTCSPTGSSEEMKVYPRTILLIGRVGKKYNAQPGGEPMSSKVVVFSLSLIAICQLFSGCGGGSASRPGPFHLASRGSCAGTVQDECRREERHQSAARRMEVVRLH